MIKYIFSIIIIFTMNSCTSTTDQCIPIDLTCEYLVNPIGIDKQNPRLKWKLNDSRKGAKQRAYKICVGTDSSDVLSGKGNMWETGNVSNDKMLVNYNGTKLEPFTKYFWSVTVWDKEDKVCTKSAISYFETGMMQMINWKGAWISDTRNIDLKPAAYFRKEFNTKKKIESARVYVAVAGLYELLINGNRIGDHQLDPIYTRFDRRTNYVSYDITSHLSKDNSIGVLLGNGWYNHQSTAVWFFHEAPWRARPRFCLDLRIKYEDGTYEIISTNNDWKTSLSPVIFNSIYTAEHYDSRLEQIGWAEYGFDDSEWEKVILETAPSQNIVSQLLHPIRNVTEISPKSIKKISSTKYLFDLGLNISGVSKVTIEGIKGTVVRVTHAEQLGNDGNIDLSNIDLHYRPTDDKDPFQTDIYILNGNGPQTFSPRFNYKGFQYVEVISSEPITMHKKDLTGFFMHSDVPSIGKLNSSNEIINKIWEATNNSYLSNLFGYPTDCPQREKNGWTGDAHIAIETALYNFDGITIYEKWLKDHQDEQQPNGVLPAIIPSSGWGYKWANGPDWTSTIAIIPWNIYKFYGDINLLRECYANIKLYVDHITDISTDYLTDWGLGDWVPVKSETPVEYTSSIYYYVDVLILAKTAKLLNNQTDFENYSQLAKNIKRAINNKYFNKKTSIYGSGNQTELSTALYWGIVSDEYKEQVAYNLAKRVEQDGKHIDVGLLGSKTILSALSENGYADLAYELASAETFPSWGWWIVNGATTLLENWAIDAKRDLSRNHIMFGEISAWFYKTLGGILPDLNNPGFKNIILKPNFVLGLENFEANYESQYGEIISSWKRNNNNEIIYNVNIPPNSTASLFLNGKSITNDDNNIEYTKVESDGDNTSFKINLEAGKYTFTIK